MKKLSLSDGEWKIMNLLWARAPRTVPELVDELREDTGWSRATVNMMLRRLEEHGAVRYEEGARAREFYPLLQRGDTVLRETRSFLSRVYGGSLGSLVASMAGQQALTKQEIDELYEILRRAEEEAEK